MRPKPIDKNQIWLAIEATPVGSTVTASDLIARFTNVDIGSSAPAADLTISVCRAIHDALWASVIEQVYNGRPQVTYRRVATPELEARAEERQKRTRKQLRAEQRAEWEKRYG